MFNGLNDSPENIIKRLEKLKQWQDKQKKILIEKQNAQRAILNKEQEEVYDRLGFSQKCSKKLEKEKIPIVEDSEKTCKKSDVQHDNLDKFEEYQNNDSDNIPKRPFLKRGQGLTARFKIDPNSLKLNNLPKYKYANTHKKFIKSRKKNITTSKCKNDVNGKDKSITAENDESKNQNDIDLSSYNFKPRRLYEDCTQKISDSNLESRLELQKIDDKTSSNKENSSCDTIKIKSSNKSSDFKPLSWATILDPQNIKPIELSQLRRNSTSSNYKFDDDETGNLSLFELLEKKAEEGSICLDTSSIQRWIQNKIKSIKMTEDDSSILISNLDELKNCRIQPFPFDIDENKLLRGDTNDSEKDDDDEDDSDESDNGNKRSDCLDLEKESRCEKGSVRFSDEVQINEVKQNDVNDIEDYDDNDTEEYDDNYNEENDDNDEGKLISKEMHDINTTTASTSVDKEEFEKFKAQLFTGSSLLNSIENLTLINNNEKIEEFKNEIIEKSDILKTKLIELENEIETFQKHNSELIKMKQEHELEKVQFEQNKIEFEDKLNDERIKLEIYLHDERLKIEDERKKLEKQIKLTKGPNRKERDEIIKLKEQIECLQKELKDKENKHVSAQARLRAQIRNLEKDLKDLTFELDHMKKENKRLKNDNIRLNRQESNKVLKEINKTIAKLAAPKAKEISVSKVSNQNPKQVIATVTSHNKKHLSGQNKSKSVPNLYSKKRDCSSKNTKNGDDDDDDNGTDDDEEFEHSSEYESTGFDDDSSSNEQEIRKKLSKSKKTIIDQQSNILESNTSLNGSSSRDQFKREILNSDGSKDIWYTNGNLKKISADGMIIRMLYYNKDIKETNINDGTIKYYYFETNTWHTTYLDGLEILEFPNGQTEHRHKNGIVEVHFPNGSIRITDPNDEMKAEEWRYPDGTISIKLKNGDKILSLPNGQKEIHTKSHKRREYPDGTVKLVYPDGSQETRYSNGRVRLKDKDGNLIMDSENMK